MTLTARFREALSFAFDLHQKQERKGSGVPYFAHLMGVASLVLEHGADEDEAIAALLHDAAEDQGGRPVLNVIQQRFGERVAAIVEGCTDSLDETKAPWRVRKERYLAHLKDASPSVQLVAACDKLYNARTILDDHRRHGDALWVRFSGGRDGVLWYYDALAKAVAVDNPVAGELKRAVEALLEAADSPVRS